MNTTRIVTKGTIALFLIASLTSLITPAAALAQAPPTQVIFASTNSAGGGGSLNPFGFWVWCFLTGTDQPYAGECAGTMYFYPITVKPVDVFAVPTVVGSTATIHVQATDASFQCDLSGTIGTKVTVSVTCPTGPRTSTDSMPNANVVVKP